VPHIALLLPLKSASFGPAAEAVKQGFEAAATLEKQGLPIRVYGYFDESKDVPALYREVIANGARAVVGPLTRSGVSALAAEKNIPVPTLALNVADAPPAQNLYFFGMAAEDEARLTARLAAQRGLQKAIVITNHSQLAQRLQFAFEAEWNTSGRRIIREIEFNDDPAPLSEISAAPDTLVFFAFDAEQARLTRPYLPDNLAIYATSQIFVGNGDTLTNNDLNGIRFVDMPWLLQTDHPAVMIYPRANPPLSADRERLYALGIDAFRLIQLMVTNKVGGALPLDGVTGSIQLNGHTFQRTAIPAVFVQGHAQLPDAPVTPQIQMFPAQFGIKPGPAASPP